MRRSILIFNILALVILLFAAAGKTPPPYQTPTSLAVQTDYRQGLTRLQQSLRTLSQNAERQDTSEAGRATLRTVFRQCRTHYKKVEFLLAWLDEDGAKDLLNGAPLPALERNSPNLSVLPPRGLQPLEILIYADATEPGSAETIAQLARDLLHDFTNTTAPQHTVALDDRQVFEAVRFGLLRTMTMSIVGFDTPASGEAISECAIGMQAMWEALSVYQPHLRPRHAALADSLAALFPEAIAYLQTHLDFDTFDRAHFVREFANPLYRLTLRAHLATGVETMYEVNRFNLLPPVNYFAESPFASDFLNPYAYTALDPKENSAAIHALGRLLFFDPVLSSSNTLACATCHQPTLAFTDGLAKSRSADGLGTVKRNAPTLINAVFADRYFWDLRAGRLEDQVEHVVYSPDEFHTDFVEVAEKLAQSDEYLRLFQTAFRQPPNKHTLSTALASYVLSLRSTDSPMDRYLRGELIVVSPAAVRGFNLFMGKAVCGTCHFAPTYAGLVPPTFQENESEVIGVPTRPDTLHLVLDPDLGRYDGRLKERAEHLKHSFKTPTVRNAALTAPYMHNGTYQTLAQVVDFYNRGGGAGMGLDLPHQTLPFDHLSLSAGEMADLVNFMETLTDTSGLTAAPIRLPVFEKKPAWGERKVGGAY